MRAKHFKILGILLAVFLVTFVGVRMALLDTKIDFIQTYRVPDFPNLADLDVSGNGLWSVAVDGKVVINKGNNEQRPIASTTKMILALAVMDKKPFEKGESGEKITITQEYYNDYAWQVRNGGSRTLVQIGEEISEYEALESVLIASSNNMADSLAKWAFGSQEEYKKYAENMLSQWGINDTVIGEDASGFHDNTVSTTTDLAIIADKVLRQPVLAEIVASQQVVVPMAGTLINTNKLLGKNGIVGIKTGYTGASGYCLVLGYWQGGHTVTIVYLGATTREDSFAQGIEITQKLQEKLVETILIEEGDEVGYYKMWWDDNKAVVAGEKKLGLGFDGANSNVKIEENELQIAIENQNYEITLIEPEYKKEPSIWQRFLRVFGWEK